MLYSYDIFDTLITRRTATPKGIFSIMSEVLKRDFDYKFSNYFCNHFYEIRVGSERDARRLSNYTEIHLEDIYELMAHRCSLNTEEKQFLIDLELSIEEEYCIPITLEIDNLKQNKERGDLVVLISDMYLSEFQLCHIMNKFDSVFKSTKCFVSSEYRVNKEQGLYEQVFEKLQVPVHCWRHVGDNRKADFKAAIERGIQSELVKTVDLLDWEKRVFQENQVAWQIICGASKNARRNNQQSIAFDIGVSVGTSILFPYVKWVLEECVKQDITDVYFIARDGFILQSIFTILVEAMRLNLKLHYIYGSREVWQLANVRTPQFSYLQYLKDKEYGEKGTVESYFNGLNVEATLMKDELPEKFQDLNKICKLEEFVALLNENKILRLKVEDAILKKRKILQQYLEQEIGNKKKIAFVDMQGTGKTISHLCNEFFMSPIHCFMFYCSTNIKSKFCKIHSYQHEYLNITTYLLEVFARALHGKTVSYYEKDGKIVPRLEDDENKFLKDYGYKDYMEGVIKCCREIVKFPINLIENIDFTQVCSSYMQLLNTLEDEKLKNWLGDLPFSNPYSGKEFIFRYGPRLTKDQIEELAQGKSLDANSYQGIRLPFSLLRLSEEEREYIKKSRSINFQNSRKIYKVSEDRIAKKVAIYGAGTVGKQLYQQLKESKNIDIVLWVDKNALKLQNQGFSVKPITSLKQGCYEQVVIAVANKNTANEIMKELENQGISKSKCFWQDYLVSEN